MSPAAPITEHTFRIVFSIPGDSLEPHLDALADAGADDAAFMGPAADGTMTGEFDREAPTFPAAVVSALEALRTAIPDSRLVRVLPDDLVTVAAIAARTGRSDESIRLLAHGRRGPGTFPAATGWINEKTQVWRWADVARWFGDALGEPPEAAEHADFLAAINDVLDLGVRAEHLADRPEDLEAALAFLPSAA